MIQFFSGNLQISKTNLIKMYFYFNWVFLFFIFSLDPFDFSPKCLAHFEQRHRFTFISINVDKCERFDWVGSIDVCCRISNCVRFCCEFGLVLFNKQKKNCMAWSILLNFSVAHRIRWRFDKICMIYVNTDAMNEREIGSKLLKEFKRVCLLLMLVTFAFVKRIHF